MLAPDLPGRSALIGPINHRLESPALRREERMQTSDRHLKLALNPDLIKKNEAGNVTLFASGWNNVELASDEFLEAIRRGWAYCAQLTGSRKADNFLASNVASVDVDYGLAIEAAHEHPLVKNHALFLYTTVRHTPEAHRFRVVFVLPRTITKAGQMVSIMRTLTRMMGEDRAAVEATRISFGNRRAEIHWMGRQVTTEFLLSPVVSWRRGRRQQGDFYRNQSFSSILLSPSCPFWPTEIWDATSFIFRPRSALEGAVSRSAARASGP
jgi:hypothetical protein